MKIKTALPRKTAKQAKAEKAVTAPKPHLNYHRGMELELWTYDLNLRHNWTVANAAVRKPRVAHVVFVRLTRNGVTGLGEAAPSMRYGETADAVVGFLKRIDPAILSFEDPASSMAQIEALSPGHQSAKAALNMALLDGAARLARKPLHQFLHLGFREGEHVTSFSIGIDDPDTIRTKVLDATQYPILKLKLGSPTDRENLAALRDVAPDKLLRLDANEAWPSPDVALRNIEWLAQDLHVEFIEQPMPATRPVSDFAWLKERSPLPVFADESFHSVADASLCAEGFHGVNIKLIKTGGITGALQALKAARAAGLQTMIGCMVESSLGISAAAHLAELADHLDLDGNLLVTNDPFQGVTAPSGILSFATSPDRLGLQVQPKPS